MMWVLDYYALLVVEGGTQLYRSPHSCVVCVSGIVEVNFIVSGSEMLLIRLILPLHLSFVLVPLSHGHDTTPFFG